MSELEIILKLATSLDGRIGAPSGESRWITGPEARAEVHAMRAAADAVMIGSGTAMADDPELTVRVGAAPSRQPLRIVVDSRLRLPLRSKLVATISEAPLLVVGAADADAAARAALEKAGAQVALTPRKGAGVDLAALMDVLRIRFGVRKVLTEGGGRLAASLIAEGLVTRLEWFRAPMVLGSDGRPAIGALKLARLSDAPKFKRLAVREIGPDLWETFARA